MTRAYISANVKDELSIKQIRDQLWSITDASRFYKKKDPHITVIPPFTIKDGNEEEVERIVDQHSIRGRDVSIKTLGVYENILEPYVVLLVVDVELDDVRSELLDELPRYTDGKIVEPVRPHITLFKTQGWWDSIEDELKLKLQKEIKHRQSFNDTEVRSLELHYT